MKLLVTGGAGYIGSVVTTLLLDAGHDVTVLDDLSTGHESSVPQGAGFVRGRVHDAIGDVLTRDAAFDGVLHFAAFIAAGESVQKPEKYWDNNVGGTIWVSPSREGGAAFRILLPAVSESAAGRRTPSPVHSAALT